MENTFSTNSLKEDIDCLFSNYPIKEKYGVFNKEHPVYKLISTTIPNRIKDVLNLRESNDYKFSGSPGQGNWAGVPLFAIFNTNITISSQHGVYIVYLLSEDNQRFYLSLNQGCSKLRAEYSPKEVIAKLADVSGAIQNKIDSNGFSTDISKIHIGNNKNSPYYEKGTIFYKEYKKDQVPDDDVLISDLKRMLEIYDAYAARPTDFPLYYNFPEISKFNEKYGGVSSSHDESTGEENKGNNQDKQLPTYPLNTIIYGAPGTGKSYALKNEVEKVFGNSSENYERVTFHPDYSYANFVGTYKPVPTIDSGKSTITYKYVPGPFMKIYVKALKNKNEPYILIIEEINRAMVAAVFGDIFQLLDRNKDGESEYPVQASEDIIQYLKDNGNDDESLKLPSNLYIWATMNSADQGVFPLDTAFKRRWYFEYLDINNGENKIAELGTVNLMIGANNPKDINWNDLRKEINNKLIEYNINEDKLLGPHFISIHSIIDENGKIDTEKFKNVFKNKVIMYLFDDAAKQVRAKIFGGCWNTAKTYSAICGEFDRIGLGIFPQDIRNNLTEHQNE